jgi:uncharacterized protein (TIGR02118 family)
MSVTLLALYRRPDGGEEAFEVFHRRYVDEHLPLMARVPGLRTTTVHRVARAYTESDLVLVTEMVFDDQASLDTAMASEEMRAAGRNLREIGPGLLTLLALEPDRDFDTPP